MGLRLTPMIYKVDNDDGPGRFFGHHLPGAEFRDWLRP